MPFLKGRADMKRDSMCAIAGSALVWLLAFPTVAADRHADAIFAICRAEQHVDLAKGGETIAIETGMGTGGFAIATASRAAQQWFNYGITLFHAFYHADNRRAFDHAVADDPRCAMCLWGQALSRGPTQNFDAEDDDLKAALVMAQKAVTLARTAREKLLTAAMVRRYSRTADAPAERDFANDLLAAEKAGPPTPDLRLLAAEALLTAWRRGDKPAAADAIALIEPILARDPGNTAAIHYYIHATEFVGKPMLALASAEKLAALAPRASHLVHMAAHTFFRVGRYQDAATINAAALRIAAQHLADTRAPGPLAGAEYYGHNLQFGMAGTLMSGDAALALKFADHLHRAFPEASFASDDMSGDEAERFAIYARYDPARMLALPEPAVDKPVTRALWHYGRGEALATQRDAAGVAREAALVTGDDNLVKVARGVLAGRAAMLQGRYVAAAAAYEAAAETQEKLLVSMWDPPPFWYPVRRSVAAAWLAARQFDKAAAAAQASLKDWPGDPLALLVLSRAEDGMARAREARAHNAQALGLWEGDLARVDPDGI